MHNTYLPKREKRNGGARLVRTGKEKWNMRRGGIRQEEQRKWKENERDGREMELEEGLQQFYQAID